MRVILPLNGSIDFGTARTISVPGIASYDYVNQSPGAERVGGVTLNLEPLRQQNNEFAEDIQQVRGSGVSLNDVSYWFIRGVVRGIQESCKDAAGPIVGVRFTLRELMIHSVDSKEVAYYTATTHALREFFKPERMVAFQPS
jgi:translation elongation factor EF-G